MSLNSPLAATVNNLSGANNSENQNSTDIASLTNQLSQVVQYVQANAFPTSQILTPGQVSQASGITSTITNTTNNGATKWVAPFLIFSNKPQNITSGWVTVTGLSTVVPSTATTAICEISGDGYATTPQALVQAQASASASYQQNLIRGPNPVFGDISDSTFLEQVFIQISAQSFQYQVSGPASGEAFQDLSLTVIGYQ